MQDTHKIHQDTCILCASLMSALRVEARGQGLAKDGKHYRILEHTTGYFFQEGFLPSQTTERGEEEGEKDEEEGGEGEGGDNRTTQKKKKKKNPPSQEAEGSQESCSGCCACLGS